MADLETIGLNELSLHPVDSAWCMIQKCDHSAKQLFKAEIYLSLYCMKAETQVYTWQHEMYVTPPLGFDYGNVCTRLEAHAVVN